MKVLVLTRHGRLAAGSRYRTYQYLPYLRAQGFDVTVAPLLDDAYIHRRFAGQPPDWQHVARAYASRARALLKSRRFDLVWLEREALPWIPGRLEALLAQIGAPYVVDYDDAIFHVYDQHASSIVRRLMAGKIDRIMRGSALVVVGNRYLFDRAKAAGARRIEIIPTVVDLDRYPVSPPPENPTFTIGWIGTPLTARYLELVRPALQALCARGEARVVAIGAGPLNWNDVPLEVRPWSETTEVADLQAIDVGIMPLPDSPFERGKCGLKLIQYMACARPVVASPVGVNVEIVRDALNGFTATTNEEWISALCALKDDRPRRWRMGEAGRALVQEHFSLHLTAPRLAHLLQSVGDGCRR